MMGMGMVMSTTFRLVPDSASVLPGVEKWLEESDHRKVVVAAIRSRVKRKNYASDMDWFLAVAVPSYRPEIRAFYRGESPALGEMLTSFQIELLTADMIATLTDVYNNTNTVARSA